MHYGYTAYKKILCRPIAIRIYAQPKQTFMNNSCHMTVNNDTQSITSVGGGGYNYTSENALYLHR